MEETVLASGTIPVSVVQMSFKNDEGQEVKYRQLRLHGKRVIDFKLKESKDYGTVEMLLDSMQTTASSTVRLTKPE